MFTYIFPSGVGLRAFESKTDSTMSFVSVIRSEFREDFAILVRLTSNLEKDYINPLCVKCIASPTFRNVERVGL